VTTQAQRAILEVLDKTGGNIGATAQQLGLSDEYVRQQARKTGTTRNVGPPEAQPETAMALVEAPVKEKEVGPVQSLQEAFLDAILPQNKDSIVGLRDTLLTNLQDLAEDMALPPRMQISLLRLLLEYENQVRAIARPAMNLTVHDERRVDMTVLVDKLDAMPTEALAALSKGKMPQIIDAE